jgi:hypothetical protein
MVVPAKRRSVVSWRRRLGPCDLLRRGQLRHRELKPLRRSRISLGSGISDNWN